MATVKKGTVHRRPRSSREVLERLRASRIAVIRGPRRTPAVPIEPLVVPGLEKAIREVRSER